MLTEDYITEVYCFIDDMMKECWKNIRKRGPGPKLSDAEVITMEIAGESLGMDCDKTIHRYFRVRRACGLDISEGCGSICQNAAEEGTLQES